MAIGAIGGENQLLLRSPESPTLVGGSSVSSVPFDAPPARVVPISEISEVEGSAAASAQGPTFESIFGHMILEAAAKDQSASDKTQALASGASDDLHGTMIATKEAEISVKMVATIRNRLVDAFHELWRTSV
jgi:flagellar hook-basal body complex protein FliE